MDYYDVKKTKAKAHPNISMGQLWVTKNFNASSVLIVRMSIISTYDDTKEYKQGISNFLELNNLPPHLQDRFMLQKHTLYTDHHIHIQMEAWITIRNFQATCSSPEALFSASLDRESSSISSTLYSSPLR